MKGTYTPEYIGSGQYGKCSKCGLLPTVEGHDGCLGTLPDAQIMNACCGHGDDSYAYIQYWDGNIIRGNGAITIQKKLLNTMPG